MDLLNQIVDCIAEYEATAMTDAHDEKAEDGPNHDPNCYGSGFNAGVISAARQIREAIAEIIQNHETQHGPEERPDWSQILRS